MKRKPAAKPEDAPAAGAVELPVFPYTRPAFPGDPPAEMPSPRPLPELLAEVAKHCERAAQGDDGPPGASFWLGQAAFALLGELAARAWRDDGMAAVRLFDLSREASRLMLCAYRERLPGVIDRARILPDVPGFNSRERDRMEGWARLMDEIGQGEESPVPLVPEGKNALGIPIFPRPALWRASAIT